MTYISMSPKVICEENCEGAKQPSGGGSPRAGKIRILSPPKKKKKKKKKKVSDAYILGKDY